MNSEKEYWPSLHDELQHSFTLENNTHYFIREYPYKQKIVHLITLFLILKSSSIFSPINHAVDCVLCSSNIFNYPEDISICDTRYVPCTLIYKQQMMTIAFVPGVGSGGGSATLKSSLHCAQYSLVANSAWSLPVATRALRLAATVWLISQAVKFTFSAVLVIVFGWMSACAPGETF
jgi:hypothetical protein